jgi:hypothetical protein
MEFHGVGTDFVFAGFPTAFRHFSNNNNYDTVRVGVNYLLNVPAPAVVAKY